MSNPKHFLDSSIVRPLLFGVEGYRKYLSKQLPGKRYISQYVQMEINRSFLVQCIAFYYTLKLPTMKTVNEAIEFWSNKFQKQELKAVLQLIPQITANAELDLDSKKDKKEALIFIKKIIYRIDSRIRNTFIVSGYDTVHCKRAKVLLKNDKSGEDEDLRIFDNEFKNTKECRENCGIAKFILESNKKYVDEYIKIAPNLPKNNENRGFIDITQHLNKVVAGGQHVLTCRHCGNIGDAVIALESPSEMHLAHTDSSFNHLCPPLKKQNQQFISSAKFHQKTE